LNPESSSLFENCNNMLSFADRLLPAQIVSIFNLYAPV
jgi:hypothetical protein